MYACMTPVGFDTSDKFENHWPRVLKRILCCAQDSQMLILICIAYTVSKVNFNG